jgi:hypothetical protein
LQRNPKSLTFFQIFLRITNYESYDTHTHTWYHESFTNEKIQSLQIKCILEEIKQPMHVEHHVQSNKVKYCVDISAHAHNWTYIDIYNKQIQDVSIIPCFCYEKYAFKTT